MIAAMVVAGSGLPDDIAALKHLVLAREAELAAVQAELAQAKARETSAEAMILQLRLAVEKMRRELYGQRSERGSRSTPPDGDATHHASAFRNDPSLTSTPDLIFFTPETISEIVSVFWLGRARSPRCEHQQSVRGHRMHGARRLRIALVGCGNFAHSALLPSMVSAPIEIGAVCDRDLARAEKTAAGLGAVPTYADLERLLGRESLDAIVMAVGPTVYPELATRAMRAGVHVYIEKPPALTVEDAMRMAEVSRETGRQLVVGFMKRFGTAYRMAKELTSTPEFGPLTHVTAKMTSGRYVPIWSSELTPNSFVLDHSIHYLDLLQHYAGQVEWLCAQSSSGGDRVGFAVLLRFLSGATGLLEISNFESRGVSNERIQLMGVGRSVIIDNVARLSYRRGAPPMERGRALDPEQDTLVWEPNATAISPENSSLAHMGYLGEMRHFAETLLRGEVVRPNIEDGIAALRLAHAILDSRGQPRMLAS